MYWMAAVDHRSRLADRHSAAALGWNAGTRLNIRTLQLPGEALSGAVPTSLPGDARERLPPILADLCDTTREAVQLSCAAARGVERVHGRELVDVQR